MSAPTRSTERGFSLPEILVVLSIIMLLAVLNIPNMRRAKQAAENAAAVESMHAIRTTQEAYRISHGSYASTFSELTDTGQGALLKGTTGSSGGAAEDVLYYKGYIFRLRRTAPDEYTVTAEPALDRTNRPYYEANQTGFMHIYQPAEWLQTGVGTGEKK
jgi:prepilin-type N-terminal cleavage/methylation domain-containing protein